MATVDSLDIKIESDASSAEKALDSLSNRLSNIFKQMKSAGQVKMFDLSGSVNISKLQKQINSIDFSSIDNFKKRIKGAGSSLEFTGSMDKLGAEIDNTESKLETLLQKEEKAMAIGNADIGNKTFRSLIYDIETTSNYLQNLYNQMDGLQAKMSTAMNIQPNASLSSVGQEFYDKFINASSGGAKFGGTLVDIDSFMAEYEKLGATATKVNNQIATEVNSEVTPSIENLKASLNSDVQKVPVMQRVSDNLRQISQHLPNLSKIGSYAKKANSNLQRLTKNFNLLGRLGTMLKRMALYKVFNAIIRSVGEAFKDLDAFSLKIGSAFSSNVNKLKADFKLLGRSIATAFEPLINVATPMIDFLVQKLVGAINTISQLFAALTGSNTWTKATYQANEYTNATNGAADAQKKFNKQLHKIDELNTLSTNDSSGGSGSGNSGVNPNAFTTEQVNSSILNLAEKIKDAWAKADFTEIGSIFGTKVVDVLDKINWGSIKNVAEKLGKSFATGLNGFFETENLFSSLGETIAESLNTAFTGLYTFAKEFKWDSLGKGISESINTFFEKFDFATAGMTFTEFASGALSTITSAISNTDWSNVGSKIIELISNIDWVKLFAGAVTLTGSIASGFLQLVMGAASELSSNMADLFSEVGLDSVAGFFQGMSDNLKTSAEWIKEKFQVIIDKVKDFFGIHSPSTVFAEIGGYLIDGLKNGITTAISNIGTWIKSNIIDKFTDNSTWSDALDKLKEIGTGIVSKLKTGITSGASTIATFVKTKLITPIQNKFKDIKDFVMTINIPTWSDIKTKVSNLVTNIKNNIKAKFDIQIPTWADIKDTFVEIYNNAKETLSTKFGINIPSFNDIKSSITSLVTDVTNNLKSKFSFSIPTWNDIKTTISNLVTTVTTNLKSTFSINVPTWKDIKKGFTDLVDNIKNALVGSFTIKIPEVSLSIKKTEGKTTLDKAWNNLFGGKPTFSVSYKAKGGFLDPNINSATLYAMGENGIPEMLGTVGGKSAVAGGAEITGISDTIRQTSQMEIEVMRKQNELLSALLKKETGISYKDVFNATRRGANEYKMINGKPAFN